MTIRKQALATTALFALVHSPQAAEIPEGLTWLPSDPLDLPLNGGHAYDLWLNLSSVTNSSRLAPFIFNGVNYGNLPHAIPGCTGGGMFPGTKMWTPYASQYGSGTAAGELVKLSNGTGGGPYPANSSMYYGGASPVANTEGGSLGARTAAVPGVKTVAFQLSMGEAYGYALWDADGDGPGPEDMPKLKVFGASGEPLGTLDASFSEVVKKAYNGSLEMPPGSGLDEDVYINTYGLQWNLAGIEEPIGSFQADWTGVQHAQLWSLRLDQTDAAYGSFVFDLTSNWTGAENGTWAAAGNWQGGTPASAGKAVFSTGGGVVLDADASVGQITIATPGDFTIDTGNGSKLTASLNISTASTGTPASHTVSADLVFPSVVTLDTGADSTLTLSGNASGTGFYKRGAGTLNLEGANDFSGVLVSGGGTIRASGTNLTSAGSLLDIKNSRVILAGDDRFEAEFKAKLSGTSIPGQSAYLQLGEPEGPAVSQTFAQLNAAKPQYVKDLNPNPQTEPPVHVVGGSAGISTLTLKGGTYSGNLGGSGTHENNLSLAVDGALTLQGTSTYTGETVVKAGGTLQVNREAALSANGNLRLEGGLLALGGFSYIVPGGEDDIGSLVSESYDHFTRAAGSGAGEIDLSQGGGFKAAGGVRTVNLGGAGAAVTWGQGGFTGDGVPLVLSSDTTGKLIFANPIQLGSAARTVQVEANGTAELSGALGGSGGLRKSGNGYLILSGANDYTGPTRIEGGQLRLPALGDAGGPGALGNTSSAPSSLVLAGAGPDGYGGGQLVFTGTEDASTNRLFTISGPAGTIANDGPAALHFTATGQVAYEHDGPVTVELRGTSNADNRFDPLVADNGSQPVILRKGGQAGMGGTGGRWHLANEANSYTGGTLIISGVLEVSKLADGGAISSIGASSNAASGLMLFRGGIEYTGSGDTTDRLFSISTGTATAASRIDSSGTGPLDFTNTGDLGYTDVNGNAREIGGGGFLVLGGSHEGVNRLAARIGGYSATNAKLRKEGAGTWQLTHTGSSYTGTTEILGGTLAVRSMGNGGIPVVMNTTAGSAEATVTNAAGLAAGQAVEGPGLPAGTTIAAINGAAVTLSQAATNTYVSGGNRNKIAGTPSSIGISTSSGGNLLIDGGTLQYLGTGDASDRLFTIGAGGAALDASGSGELLFTNPGAVLHAAEGTPRTLALKGSGKGSLAAAIGDAGAGAVSLLKSGSGSWTLSGANGYGGSTRVEGGTLRLTREMLADAAEVSVAAGAVLELDYDGGTADTVGTLVLDGVPAVSGIWGAEGSGAPHVSPLLSGSGRLNVVAGPFEQWAAQIADPGARERGQDGDGDGFSNLLEFLFGTSPSAPDGSLLSTECDGETLVIRWNELSAGGSYLLQESGTMEAEGWTGSGIAPAVAPDQDGVPEGHVRKEAAVPLDGSRKFYRVTGSEN